MSPPRSRKDDFLARRARALAARTALLAGAQMCETRGRYGWDTRRAARSAMLLAYRIGRPVYRVDHCPACGHWHIHSKDDEPASPEQPGRQDEKAVDR